MKFNNIIGLDYSVDMLKIAKSKKIYKKLIQESLSKKTTLRSNQLDVVLCTGVLTSGHVGAKAINELIRVTKNRGYLILSIAENIYEKLGFKKKIEKNNFQIWEKKFENGRKNRIFQTTLIFLRPIPTPQNVDVEGPQILFPKKRMSEFLRV
jgi:ubiquinone/menaquinone biosynthesis C-methylase UbiE